MYRIKIEKLLPTYLCKNLNMSNTTTNTKLARVSTIAKSCKVMLSNVTPDKETIDAMLAIIIDICDEMKVIPPNVQTIEIKQPVIVQIPNPIVTATIDEPKVKKIKKKVRPPTPESESASESDAGSELEPEPEPEPEPIQKKKPKQDIKVTVTNVATAIPAANISVKDESKHTVDDKRKKKIDRYGVPPKKTNNPVRSPSPVDDINVSDDQDSQSQPQQQSNQRPSQLQQQPQQGNQQSNQQQPQQGNQQPQQQPQQGNQQQPQPNKQVTVNTNMTNTEVVTEAKPANVWNTKQQSKQSSQTTVAPQEFPSLDESKNITPTYANGNGHTYTRPMNFTFEAEVNEADLFGLNKPEIAENWRFLSSGNPSVEVK